MSLPLTLGRFEGLRLTNDGVKIEYRVGSSRIVERAEAVDSAIVRHGTVKSSAKGVETISANPFSNLDTG